VSAVSQPERTFASVLAGGPSDRVFDGVAIDPVRTEQLGALGYFVDAGERATGRTSVEFPKVRTVKTASDPEKFVYPEVFFDICVDVSDTAVLDSAGKQIPVEVDKRQTAVIGAYAEPNEGWFVSFLEYKSGGEACKR
jgi:hypothetical protein